MLRENLTIGNNRAGFNNLLRTVISYLPGKRLSDARIGLESTGHYSVNLTNFLKAEGFEVTIFNPLHVNLYRKA